MAAITLYQAATEVADLFDQMDPETGELPEGYEHACVVVAAKGAATVAYLQERAGHEKMIEDAIAQLQGKLAVLKARNARLRGYLADCMRLAGVTEIGNPVHRARLYKDRDKAVEVFDQRQIPAQYLNRPKPPEPSPDKRAIKTALESGIDVPGARIVNRDRLEIK